MNRPIAFFLVVCIALAAVLLFITSLRPKPPRFELPEGVQQVTGILRPAELSLARRGSHVLEVGGHKLSFVESASFPLTPYENTEVTIQGIFEENTDPHFLPVLVVQRLTPKTVVSRPWKIAPLNLSLSAPSDWNGVLTGSSLRFTLMGDTKPFLTIAPASLKELPGGTPEMVGGQKAVSTMEGGTGSQILYVEHPKGILAIVFAPAVSADEAVELAQRFQDVLLSFAFASRPSAGGTGASAGSGTNVGVPCGGEAGILCPAGQYCEVTDSETNIGRCKPLR